MSQQFTILFDLDGTLVDTAPDLISCSQSCDEKNLVIKKKVYLTLKNLPVKAHGS